MVSSSGPRRGDGVDRAHGGESVAPGIATYRSLLIPQLIASALT
jgi:hypothetical protein